MFGLGKGLFGVVVLDDAIDQEEEFLAGFGVELFNLVDALEHVFVERGKLSLPHQVIHGHIEGVGDL